MKADGNRIGQAIAAHVERAVRAAQHEGAKTNRYHNERSREAFLEEIEQVYAPHIRAVFQTVLDNDDVPDALKDLIRSGTEPTHQVEALIAIIVLPFIIAPLAHAVSNPFILQLQQTMLASHPEKVIDPSLAALMVVKGIRDYPTALRDAEGSGINANRFEDMVKATGEPPSLQELLLLWRRGQIDGSRLDHGIRQSRVKDEWIDAVHDLRYVPPSPSDAVLFALKGHMSDGDAQKLYAEAGIDPRYFAVHKLSAGRPPGPDQELELLNRGHVNQAHVEQAIRQSDVNNVYIDDVLQLRWYYPPVRSIAPMLRNGTLNDADALHYLAAQGVPSDLAAKMVKGAKKEKTNKAHTATVSQVLKLYVTRYLTHDAALSRLVALGFAHDEATFELAAADGEEAIRLRDAAAKIIGQRYVAHRLQRSETSRDLDTLGVPHEARDQLLRVWDIERGASAKSLSAADVLAMYTREIHGWDEQHALEWLEADGYSTADAHSLMQLASAGTSRTPGRARSLTQAQVLKLYKLGRIAEQDALERLRDMGLSEPNARLLMQENAPTTGG